MPQRTDGPTLNLELNLLMFEPILDFVACPDPQGTHRMAYWSWGEKSAAHVVFCVHGLTRQGRDFDLLAQALHEAEETRDQAILYLEQREAELMEQAAQTEAELRATSDSLKDARREVDDLTNYIARIKAKT